MSKEPVSQASGQPNPTPQKDHKKTAESGHVSVIAPISLLVLAGTFVIAGLAGPEQTPVADQPVTALFENERLSANSYRIAVAPEGYTSPELLEADWHRLAERLCGGDSYETSLESGIAPSAQAAPASLIQTSGYGLEPQVPASRSITGLITCG